MGSINNLNTNYLQSILSSLRSSGSTNNPLTNGIGTANGTSQVGQAADNGQLSPFAQMLSDLQQLQQSNPTQYQQVTQQIATNLQSAAQTAQNDGNSTAASQLNQLATDFTNASQSGQLPNIQDLAQGLSGTGGHHHHHHGGHHSSTDSDSSTTDSATSTSSATSTTSTGSTSQTQTPSLSSLYGYSSQNDSLNPATIILNTLSGLDTSSSTTNSTSNS